MRGDVGFPVRIRYAKRGKVRWISHRDVARAFDSLAAAAHASGVDLIVMGTHGRSGVAHLLMGSVAERVVQTAPCPVLTVRHPEHEFILPDALFAVAKA